jgi:adenylosuccinate synthase
VRAIVVVDLGFGDSGKGLLTDCLVRTRGATLVVRYNGGAQAGHNVVAPDGRHHTFAQFGAGTFVDGVGTVLSRHVVVHPTGLLAEAAALEAKGVRDPLSRIRVSDRARLITPFHQAANRLRELARGAARHGSCGVGVGEVVEDSRTRPAEAVEAGDLHHTDRLAEKLACLRAAKRAEVEDLACPRASAPRAERERRVFTEEGLIDRWIDEATRLAHKGVVASNESLAASLRSAETVVFEGAQGVLLDEVHGFHPYTTWSCCTARNAFELIEEVAPGSPVERIGVMRSHAVRHGPGPLPTETAALQGVVTDHNRDGEWQGPVRYGWFDAVLARYAIDVVGGVDALLLTHADAPPRLAAWNVCGGYRTAEGAWPGSPATRDDAGIVRRLVPKGGYDGSDLTGLLLGASPVLEACAPTEDAVVRAVERELGRRVDFVSRGPTANDVATLVV